MTVVSTAAATPGVCAAAGRTFLFIDAAVPDPGILAGHLASPATVVPLRPDGDPLGQIAAALAGERAVDRLLILAHGEPGALRLAGMRVDAGHLLRAAPRLAAIRGTLAPGATVGLVACSVAATTAGAAFVAGLAAALGADVEASAVPLGGDAGWTGLPAAARLFTAPAPAYPHRLGWTASFQSNFSTTTGAGLNPAQTDWTGDDTLNITVASHVTAAAVANGGGGTDTLELSESMDLSVSGFTLTGFENLLVYADQTTTFTAGQLSQFTGTITAEGSQTINVAGDGNFTTLANIESFVAGDDSSNARTITINQTGASVTATSSTDAVNFSLTGITYTGTVTGNATVGDTLTLANNANIAGATIANVGTVVIANGGSVTMTETQFEGFTTVTATGNNEVILSSANGDGIVAGHADVELYQLNAAFTFTMAGNHLTVAGNAAANQSIATGTTDTLTGSISGGTGGSDTLVLDDADNIAGATVTGFENLTLGSGSSVTLAASQLAQFTGTVTAAGSETISISGNGAFTTIANVETFSVGDDSTNARTITISHAGASVTASSATDAVNFSISSGTTYTGTITGDATVGDTLTLANNASIAGATITNVGTVAIANSASVTMTESQFEGFSTVTAGGSAETLVLSSATGDGVVAGASAVESYTLNAAFTFTMAANHTNVTGSDGADQSVATGSTDTLTGTLNGGAGGSDTLVLDTGDDISGATVSNFENLTLSGGASVTMTAAQLNAFTGTVTAAGTDTVTLTTTGSITADVSAIETIAVAANTSGQTITLTAAVASGKTLTAGDALLDSFVITASAGDQTLVGGTGNDTIDGGTGADTVSGGEGEDSLTGGADADVFTGSASDLNLDVITDFAIGDSIVITGADLSALNGTAASGTILMPGLDNLTLTGITAASGNFSASFAGGNTTITLGASGGGGGGGGGSSDLVVSDGGSDSTGGARTISNTGGNPGSAAIVQNTGNNGNLVTATLPPAVQISSEGPSSAQSGDNAVNTLVTAIDNRNPSGEADMIGDARGYLNGLAATTMLDVRTIVPTQNPGITTDDPIVITGTSGGSQSEAFVIDMRSIAGKTLQVDNIEFVSIIGNATVTGGAGDNYAVGDDNAQFMSLGAGNDTLFGGGGNDTIGSASGNDLLGGDAGADKVLGGTGNDTVMGGTEADLVYGNQDADVIYGNQADDTLFGGQGGDTVFGGQNADLAYGNLGDDLIYGNFGTDTLYGGAGNDALYGGQSDAQELLFGGAGDDTLAGGKGADLMSGGDGADLFVIAADGGTDTVAEFAGAAGDRIRIAANANGTAIDSYAELRAAAGDTADGVQIALGGGNTLLLMGVRASDLQAEWFSFA